jgi:bloom syndrome protein
LNHFQATCEEDDTVQIGGLPANCENDSLQFVLQKYFGYETFKDNQREAIETVMLNRDCVITMPTGSGKTVCYTIPTIISGGTSVVVSPLLSLIYNQVKSLREKGISATHITSQMAPTERNSILHSLLKPKPDFQFLYCTPELLSCTDITATLHKMVNNKTLVNVIIDEAHCVDMWGHDFRPSYCDLGNLQLGVPLVCFTATLTDRALSSVTQSLKLTNPIIKKAPCERVNLCMHVVEKTGNHPRDIAEVILSNFPDQSGIVYCNSREQTQNMAYELAAAGVQASFYHARLDIDLKMERQKKWEDGELNVLCATSAFGMGIDKKNVRFVIHATVPGSPERYIQETGRCARDGNKGECYLYFNFNDRSTHIRNIYESPNQTRKNVAFERLNRMVEYCISNKCRTAKLQEMMGEEERTSKCGQCDMCIANKDVHLVLEDFSQYAKLMVNCIIAMKNLDEKIKFADAVMVFRGSKIKKLEKFFHISQHGSGRVISKQKATRLLQELILSGVIVENLHGLSKTTFLPVGNVCSALFDGSLVIQI